ncbi:MAG TPA: lipoprotein [Beijerinckia sp.]|nr:lipoprotein [Beijerinckia sp.]
MEADPSRGGKFGRASVSDRTQVKCGGALFAVLLAFSVALPLGGCGRRGPLDPPEAAAPTPASEAATQGAPQEGTTPSPATPVKKRPFVLDPVL